MNWPQLPLPYEQDFENKVRNTLETWRQNSSKLDNEISEARQGYSTLGVLTRHLAEAINGHTSLDGRLDSDESRIEDIESFLDENSTFIPNQISGLDYLLRAIEIIATMLRSLSLPFEYGLAFRGKANFNSTTGVTIPLPLTFPNSNFYTVSITPLENSGFIGEIWVEKGNNSFTVYNTGSDNETQFEYTVLITEYLNKTREV